MAHRGHGPGVGHGLSRRHRGERRAALDRPGPRRDAVRPAVDDHRLHARARGVDPAGRLVFLSNVPVAVVILAVGARQVPESRDGASHGRFDVLGASLGALGLGGVTYALIAAGEDPGRADVAVSGTLGVLAGIAFVVR